MEIKRGPRPLKVDVGTTAATSTTIEKGFKTTGSIQLPSGSSTTQINVYSRLGEGSWAQAEDEDGVEIQMTGLTAGTPRALPSAVYNFPRITLVAASTATDDAEVWLTS